MAVRSEPELVQEIKRLREELARREREAADKERQLERYAADLRETFKQERSRSQELKDSYKATVRALSNAVEARDAYTGKHAERVTAYGIEIARAMQVPVADGGGVEFGFLLHDVGKVAIPDAILYKPDKLTDEERALMAQHPVIGAKIVRDIAFLSDAVEVVRSHHERWDGRGYPDRLRGEEIPLAARVFAVADVLDALTTDRPYRPASPHLGGSEDDPRRTRSPVRSACRRRVHVDRRTTVPGDRGADHMSPRRARRRRRSVHPQADRDDAPGRLTVRAPRGRRRRRGAVGRPARATRARVPRRRHAEAERDRRVSAQLREELGHAATRRS